MLKKLVGLRLRNLFTGTLGKTKSGQYAKPSVGKIILYVFLYLYLAAIFAGLSISLALAFSTTFGTELEWLYNAIFMLLPFTLIFIFSIFETKGELYECKDNDLLFSLPIPANTIVLSRIIGILVLNYAEAAVLMLPAVGITLAINPNRMHALGLFIVFLVLPLLTTALASWVGFAVSRIAAKLKNKNYVTLVLSLTFLGLYFWGYTSLVGGMENFFENAEENISALGEKLSGMRFLGEIAMFSPVPFLLFLIVSALVCWITFRRICATYFRLSTETGGATRVKYRERALKEKSAFRALTRMEFSRFTSSASYMLNGGLGALMAVVAAIFLLIRKDALLAALSEMPAWMGDALPVIVAGVLVAIQAICIISAPVLSLEGNSLWILRSMPVKGKDVLLAKCMPHIVVSGACNVLAALIAVVALRPGVADTLLLLLLPLSMCVLTAFSGLGFNLVFPRFDYINETQVVKSSMSSTVTLFAQMLFGCWEIGAILVCSFFGMAYLGAGLVAFINIALSVMLYFLIVGPGVRKYNNL